MHGIFQPRVFKPGVSARACRPAWWVAALLVLVTAAEAREGGDPLAGTDATGQIELRFEPLDRPELYTGVDFVSKYVSRGIVFSSKFSTQPWAELHLPVPLFRGTDSVGQPRVIFGTWHSFQSGGPGLGQTRSGSLGNWYEADLYGGLGVTLGERLWASVQHNYYTSPSNSFGDIHELDGRLRLDDRDFWGERGFDGFATYPGLRITGEVRVPGGSRRSTYIQPSLTPTYELEQLPARPTVEFPLALGFGGNGQYVDDQGNSRRFGFFRTGIGISGPLDILPDDAGQLRWSAGFDAYFAGDKAFTGRDKDTLLVGRFGLRYSF